MFDFDVRSGNEKLAAEAVNALPALGNLPSELTEPVAAVRRRPPVIVTPDCPVREALARMVNEHAGTALVAAHGVLLGVLSERDILRRLVEQPAGVAALPVVQLMDAEPDALLETDSVGYALRKLWSRGGRPLAIVRPNGALAGQLDAQDLIAWMVDHRPSSDALQRERRDDSGY